MVRSAPAVGNRGCVGDDVRHIPDRPPVKVLVVGDSFPWPTETGGQIRLATAVSALSELGDLDLFTFYDKRGPQPSVPSSVRVRRLSVTPYGPITGARSRRIRWMLTHRTPFDVAVRSSEQRPRADFEQWVDPAYDLVWFSSARTYEWLGRPALGPTVVDLIDLEDVKERQRADLIERRPISGPLGALKRRLAASIARRNATDWQRLQSAVSARVARVVLSSSADVARSGLENAVAVVNAYPRPDRIDGTRADGGEGVTDSPVLVFQGTFDYLPNIDGAQWLVGAILPAIRELVPGARVRLVGREARAIRGLDDPPAVTVVGQVDEMGPELLGADFVLVPLRFGSGTRLKILESFAYGVPVVTTSLGAEGLDVDPGVHLLVADDPLAFADAVARLCQDADLRRRLGEAGRSRFLERYQSAEAQRAVKALATELLGRS